MNYNIFRIGFLFISWLMAFQSEAQDIKADSIFSEGRRYDIWDSTYTTSKIGMAANFFIGKGIQTGNISNYFSNPLLAGFNLEVHYKRFLFQFEDCFGFGENTKTIYFPNQLSWQENKGSYHFIGGVNLGYSLINNTNLKVAPLGGIGANLISSTFLEDSEISDYQPFIPYINFGFYADLKPVILMHYYNRVNNKDVYYTCLRISAGIKVPFKTSDYPEYYNGSMAYITLGMSLFERKFSSPKLENW